MKAISIQYVHAQSVDRHMAYTDRYGAGVLDNPLKQVVC